jgi:hypothetical protein
MAIGISKRRAKGVKVPFEKFEFSSQDKDILSLMISLGEQFKKPLVE